MTTEGKIPPGGLHPQLVKRLLDKLETDTTFRQQFQASPEQALRALGYSDPWACMQLEAGASLASPEQIRAQRAKLESVMAGVQGMTCPLETQTLKGL